MNIDTTGKILLLVFGTPVVCSFIGYAHFLFKQLVEKQIHGKQ